MENDILFQCSTNIAIQVKYISTHIIQKNYLKTKYELNKKKDTYYRQI